MTQIISSREIWSLKVWDTHKNHSNIHFVEF
jgi:hypothetical protein